ncbi:methyltransferase [Galdieria sulphuraria]|uniref:Methyltransferase n=1 Tax=Galdieria sulphuraria TaxID=130081 RepID=M2W0I6_GALSU|nr:methyltransferase [Galdieria sulphuraria]EME29126.1 methyltransferase [Galdieria sulphuraria]|eukprot:XP_005705646.1 methyltransferase [Galdieria sulphuraria]
MKGITSLGSKWFVEFEKNNVHNVYDRIAEHFTKTRYRIWPGVELFLKQTSPLDTVLDVGCGNGKNLISYRNLFCIGIDRCVPLVKTCKQRQLETAVADILELPFQSEKFDIVLCIAVLHHLCTRERRILAIQELGRVLRPGGSCLLYVWAANENDGKDEVKNTKAREKMRFLDENKQEALIPWVVIDHEKKATQLEKNLKQPSTFTLERYYHLYRQGELEEECLQSNCFHIQHSYYEQSNWCVVLDKKS